MSRPVQSTTQARAKQQMEELLDQPRMTLTEDQRYLFVSVLPNVPTLKTTTSEFVIMSHTTDLDQKINCLGFESIAVASAADWDTRLIEHVEKCYNEPHLKNATLVVFIEANMKGEAFLARKLLVNKYPRVAFPSPIPSGMIPGFLVNQKMKHDMRVGFDTAARHKQITFPETLLTTDPDPEALMIRLRGHLIDYASVVAQDKYVFTTGPWIERAKREIDSYPKSMAFALQFGMYCTDYFLNCWRYRA
jgi:hypothetical protein